MSSHSSKERNHKRWVYLVVKKAEEQTYVILEWSLMCLNHEWPEVFEIAFILSSRIPVSWVCNWNKNSHKAICIEIDLHT